MLTPTHGCLANLFSWHFWKERPAGSHLALFLGAVLPDMPLFLVGLYEFLKYKSSHPAELTWRALQNGIFDLLVNNERPPVIDVLRTNIGYHEIAWFLTQIFHTYLFWIIVYVLSVKAFPRFKWVSPLIWGVVCFHLFVDTFTHVSAVYAYFWPFIIHRVPGFVSQATPWFLKLEILIWVVWFISLPFAAYHRLINKRAKEKKILRK